MHRTESATPLDAVMVASRGPVTDVWLRRNIEEVERELPEGGSQLMWVADEVTGTVAGAITAEDAADDFDALWERLEYESLTDDERVADVRDTSMTNSDAIAELAEMVADGEVTMEDLSQAIMELAEIVGGGE